jgi:uncharacterized protein YbbC (DUF1343 family)
MNPLQKDKNCFGQDLRNLTVIPRFTLSYFIDWYKRFNEPGEFLTRERWFNLLMGNDQVIKLIKAGKSEKEIVESWQDELGKYKKIRANYLIYQ